MDVIFLDIDGVLNVPFAYIGNKKYNYKGIYPDKGFYTHAVSNLNHIIYELHTRLVITSTWRNGHTMSQLKHALTERGIYGVNIAGFTPNLSSRGEEIKTWLNENKVIKFLILDNNTKDVKSYFPNNYIETDKFRGFGIETLFERAIDILG